MADDRFAQVVNAAMTRFLVRQVDKCVRLEAYGFVGEATPATKPLPERLVSMDAVSGA